MVVIGLCDEVAILESHCWSKVTMTNSMFSMPGLHNLGNTCFMNATLQCLAYLPTFCQCAIDNNLSQIQSVNGGKFVLGQKVFLQLRSLIRKLHGVGSNKSYSSLTPRAIADLLPSIGSHGRRSRFRLGRQEDAHEFLVHLLDAMKEGELRAAGIDSRKSGWRDRLPVPRLDETTLIHRIFGGYLRSQVVCPSCKYCSNTYDPIFDLDLEVSKKRVNCISSAIAEFTCKEKLDMENRWRCSGCKKYVCPTKQLSVFRPPLTLCIQFKRFSFNSCGYRAGGGKINKQVQFSSKLKLPLSDGRKCHYNLTGVVSHIGGSSSSGHYTAFVRKPCHENVKWFHMDDSQASEVSEKSVLNNRNAYVLFYTRSEVKIEYPKPPSGGMSSLEAVKIVAARVRARADSIASTSSVETSTTNHLRSNISPSKELQGVHSECSQNESNKQLVKKKCVSPISSILPKISHHTTSSPLSSREGSLSDIKKNLKSSLQPYHLCDEDTSSDSSFSLKSIKSDSSTEISDTSSENDRADSKGPLTDSLLDDDGDASFNSDDMLERFEESSEEMSELMKLAIIKNDEISDKDESINNASNNISTSSLNQMDDVNTEKSKPITRMVLSGVQQGNIEVFGKRHKHVWKPSVENGYKNTDLLGTVAVGGWNDNEEEGESARNNASNIVLHTGKKQERVRKIVLQQMSKAERDRKRNHYLDRWDSKLDEGKVRSNAFQLKKYPKR